ncbi:MAG TPA: transcriptional repressor LexA [Actinomycetota bacterium]|nr:transcriptional repressor LexA [Actinomycetota bacterium]
MDDLTARQRRILDYIRATVRDRGYPPTVREIGEAVGLTSSSSVHSQLATLQRKGLLTRDPTKPRAIELHLPGSSRPDAVAVPVLGRIAAGAPVLAAEHVEDEIALPRGLVPEGDLFALRVAGDSMTGAGILDGDLVVVEQRDDPRSGDIVAALLPGPAEDEATVKRLRRRDGRVSLEPENPAYEPIEMIEGRILGTVVAVLRTY